jgi:PA domain
MSSALANQINMNHFISLMFSASLVAANSSPGDINAFAQTSDFPTGVSSFAIPAEERIAVDHYVMAIINTTHLGDDGDYVHTSEEKGKYGEGRIMRAEGPLVHVTAEGNVHDHTACERKLRGTHGRDLPTEPWIALVKRGRCNFEEKVQHVYDFKAIGVIVYNDKDSPSLDKMKIYDKERK